MSPENDRNLLVLSSSPHAHCGSSIRKIMAEVLVALMPAMAAAIWFFKLDALALIAVCTASCVASGGAGR